MSFVAKVTGWFHHAGVVVGHLFEGVFGKDASMAFANAAIHILQSELGKIAVAVVSELQHADLTGDQKLVQATQRVGDQAKAAGIEAGNSILHLVIELAVGFVQGHFHTA